MDTIQSTVALSQAPQVPAQYADTVREFLRARWEEIRWQMQEEFGFHNLPLLTDDQLVHTMLADTVAEIARCAAGEYDGDGESLAIVAEGIQGIVESLFATRIAGSYGYTIPEAFWSTPFGQMVAVARLHIRGDELITIAEAAELRGISTQAIGQAITAGRLTGYVDPQAPQRQGRRLVSRREVEAL